MLWIVGWALIPWLNAGANLVLETGSRSAVWEQSRTLVLLSYAALSIAIVIALWGSERIARRVETLRATTANVLKADATEPFREMNSIAGPLVASAATAIAFAVSPLVTDGPTSAVLRGVTWLVLGIALWGFLWTSPRYSSVSIVSGASVSVPTQLASTPRSGCDRSAASPSWACGCSWRGWFRLC